MPRRKGNTDASACSVAEVNNHSDGNSGRQRPSFPSSQNGSDSTSNNNYYYHHNCNNKYYYYYYYNNNNDNQRSGGRGPLMSSRPSAGFQLRVQGVGSRRARAAGGRRAGPRRSGGRERDPFGALSGRRLSGADSPSWLRWPWSCLAFTFVWVCWVYVNTVIFFIWCLLLLWFYLFCFCCRVMQTFLFHMICIAV